MQSSTQIESATHAQEQLVRLLSDLLLQLGGLQLLLNPQQSVDMPALRSGLAALEETARAALTIVRESDDDLPVLQSTSLPDALSELVEQTAEQFGLSSRISFSGVEEHNRPGEHTLSRAAERLLYLTASEALYQVSLHTEARRLRFVLNYSQNDVQMLIEDDGLNPALQPVLTDEEIIVAAPAPPFPPPVPALSTPIINDLRMRIERLGGSLEVVAAGERGTRVLARVPYVTHSHSIVVPDELPALSREPSSEESPATEIPILVVDNQAVTRAGLHRLLESYPGLRVVGEAADGIQAVSETLELGPRVVLLDAQLPNGQTLEALRQIKQLNLDTRVLLLAAQEREEYLYETLRNGADGYVLKDIAPDELAQAVRAVARGEVLIQPQLAGRLISRFGRQGRAGGIYEALTAREQEVLRLLARGMRNKEIAARLYVSERTVNFHLANIYQKLNVSGRTEALSKAIEQGLVSTNI